MAHATETSGAQELDSTREPDPVSSSELSDEQVGGALGTGLTGAFGEPPATRVFNHPALLLSPNSNFRNTALRRVQQSHGNQFVQQALLRSIQRTPSTTGTVQRECACGGTCQACQSSRANEAGQIGLQNILRSEAGNVFGSDSVIPQNGGGDRLPNGPLQLMESRFGASLEGVRVHADSQSANLAESLGANAFTSGRDIYFGGGQYSPNSTDGQRLLAHELTHTIQQQQGKQPTSVLPNRDGLQIGSPEDPLEREADLVADSIVQGSGTTAPLGPHGSGSGPGTPSIQRQPLGGGGFRDDKPVSDAPPFVDSATLVDPGKADHDVVVNAPFLVDPTRVSDQEQIRVVVHTDIFKRDDITLYAVPITSVQIPKPAQPPPTTVTTTVTTTTKVTSAPPVSPGSVVTAYDGVKLDVIAATPEHIITTKYTKFAVGAASTSALRLMDGTVVIIDAGVNNRGLATTYDALVDATMKKLADFIKTDPIREILISHAHKDHVSLIPEIMKRFRVDTIRINDVMKRWPGYKALRKEIVKLQKERLKQTEAAIKDEIAKTRAQWELENDHPDKGILQERWEKHATDELKRRMNEEPKLKERTLIPSKGGKLDVVNVDIRTGDESAADEFKAEDPLEIRETMKEPTDPKTIDRRRSTEKKDVDPYASAYLIQLPSGLRFMVLPDIRANDMDALTKRFADQVKKLQPAGEVKVQIWDATHHMQSGWKGEGLPATQLRKIVDFLSTFQMKDGADAVVVSAQADLSRPGAGTLVDPVNIWLLRSLGFEVYLATSGRDVNFFEITTTQGTKLAGTPSAKAPGPSMGEVSIKRAKMALDQLKADKQTKQVELADEKDPGKQKAIQETLSEIDSKISQIDTALNEYLKAGQEALQTKAKTRTTQSISDVKEPAIAERQKLDALLEKWNFDKPLTTDLHLTEMAMVVLRQEVNLTNPAPGSPAARALELKTVRSRINELGAQIARGGAPDSVTGELFIELQRYKAILTNELNPTDPNQKPLPEGVTRTLLADDLKSVEAKITALEGEKKAGSLERAVGSGEIIETHVVTIQKPAQESAATRTTRAGLDLAGKGLGAVMLVQTVTGQGELMKRFEAGRATGAEMLLGTAHNLGAAATAVKMVRGIPVRNGVFVVLSLLDVGAVLARDYETPEQRDIEVTYAIIANALNLGLMALGNVMMRSGHPVVMIAGFLITFAGPLIMEGLGVREWLERRYGFNPSDVIRVYQTLRKLVNEYSVIVGSIMLADRTAKGLEDLSVPDPTALREQARITARDHRINAIKLERQILGEFKTAYDDAKGNYAGLKELDEYREQFITLQREANPNNEEVAAWQEVYGEERRRLRQKMAEQQKQWDKTPSGPGTPPSYPLTLTEIRNPEPEPTKDLIKKTFDTIEASMSLDNMSAQDIRDMPQWEKLKKALESLTEEVYSTSGLDHDDIKKKDKEARLMIENARYRLDPRSQAAFRSKGLFGPNSPARAVYVEELNKYEHLLAVIHQHYIERAMSICGPALLPKGTDESQFHAEMRFLREELTANALVKMVEVAVQRYKITVETMYGPPEELVVLMFTNSADVKTYQEFIDKHDFYKTELQRVENANAAINGLIDQAWGIAKAEPGGKQEETDEIKRLKTAVALKKQAEDIRFHKRGIIFPSELVGLKAQVKEAEISELARLLGEKPNTEQLKQEEVAALQADEMEAIKKGLVPPISNRLRLIPELRRNDPTGLVNIYQLYGQINVFSGGKWIETVKSKFVENKDNAVVGAIGPGEDIQPSLDTPGTKTLRVIPLNDNAVKIFEKFDYMDLPRSNLEPLTMKDLEAMLPK
ncbi:MAG: hypothetical protein C5B55_01125 [Blastocatellia bacterium]|nr:MAG: hypothetical protein C5B55_01125 [Blastocatellia bacterium]